MDSVTKQRNTIESAVSRKLRPLGFTRHGSTLHRFVSGHIAYFDTLRTQIGLS